MNYLREKYYAQHFMPSFLGIFLNPLFLIRYSLVSGIKKHKSYMSGTMLDFGCGSKPYKSLFKVDSYIGVDIETTGHSHKDSLVDVYYNGKKLPFYDNYFDTIFTSEVFEHIFNIDEILPELNRVLKPKGFILLTCPFVWEEHEVPYDYARYSSFGINYLLEKHNFKIVSHLKTGNYIRTIFQLLITLAYSSLPNYGKLNKIIYGLFLWPLTVLGLFLSFVFPSNYTLYLNNIVLAQKNE